LLNINLAKINRHRLDRPGAG